MAKFEPTYPSWGEGPDPHQQESDRYLELLHMEVGEMTDEEAAEFMRLGETLAGVYRQEVAEQERRQNLQEEEANAKRMLGLLAKPVEQWSDAEVQEYRQLYAFGLKVNGRVMSHLYEVLKQAEG